MVPTVLFARLAPSLPLPPGKLPLSPQISAQMLTPPGSLPRFLRAQGASVLGPSHTGLCGGLTLYVPPASESHEAALGVPSRGPGTVRASVSDE